MRVKSGYFKGYFKFLMCLRNDFVTFKTHEEHPCDHGLRLPRKARHVHAHQSRASTFLEHAVTRHPRACLPGLPSPSHGEWQKHTKPLLRPVKHEHYTCKLTLSRPTCETQRQQRKSPQLKRERLLANQCALESLPTYVFGKRQTPRQQQLRPSVRERSHPFGRACLSKP